ncbi:MAG: type II toxin-antitoxin system RelE/ParE family toxin [Acidobacteria bacterium]|nr:type II toxin-antitoxin system RelE/ParE family toxin [Acidobacteriota bacterium]
MKNYRVEFLPTAKHDLRTSFLWGVSVWGKTQAGQWLNKLNVTCKKRLKQFPESCPIALESKEFGITLRQLVIDRYRVIFTIQEDSFFVHGSTNGWGSAGCIDVGSGANCEGVLKKLEERRTPILLYVSYDCNPWEQPWTKRKTQ